MWPFKKKASQPVDMREWNEDWKAGDVAECVAGKSVGVPWSNDVAPWERPRRGQQLVVTGFSEGQTFSGAKIAYFLHFNEFSHGFETRGFRKVRPVSQEESEIVRRILDAPASPDRVREDA